MAKRSPGPKKATVARPVGGGRSLLPKKTIRRPDPLPDDVVSTLGRPGVYCANYPELARRLALVGVTDKELASVFGITVEALYGWDKAHPDFLQARTRGGIMADSVVAVRLYHRAIGYDHPAVKIFMPAGADSPVYAPYVEHHPPDVQAIIWWLKNRQRRHWKDKVEIDIGGRIDVSSVPYNPALLTEEQREVMRDALLTIGPTIEGEKE